MNISIVRPKRQRRAIGLARLRTVICAQLVSEPDVSLDERGLSATTRRNSVTASPDRAIAA